MPILTILSSLGFKDYLILGLVVFGGWYYVSFQKVKSDNVILETNQITLTQTITSQNKQIDSLVKDKEQLNKNVESLSQSNDNSFNLLSQKLAEINELRKREAQLALQNPYERGNVATDRFNDILQSIGSESNRDTDKDSQ